MAKAVVDLGSQRRALLFLRADRLQYFVSCLVYVPRDRYTTAVRLQIEDILVREFGGTRLEFTARVSESPWALMHFMVRLPETSAAPVDVSEANRLRIQALLSEAARTWADRLIGAAADRLPSRPTDAEHYATAFSEAYKQVVTPADAIDHIAIINELTDDSVKLVFADGDEDGVAQLTWFLGGTHRLVEPAAPDAAKHGRRGARGATVHGHPAGRTAGVDLPVQDLTAPDHPVGRRRKPNVTRSQSDSPTRSPRSGRAASRSTGSTSW